MEHKLAAILVADVAGFSLLMAGDEMGTLTALKAHQDELITPTITRRNGRIVKFMGDGMLVEFASVVAAVQCAVEIQGGMEERNQDVHEGARIVFRIGINLGDVIFDGNDIFGDGVNLAARLEASAEPGGIIVSATVHEHVVRRLELQFDDLGFKSFKNIPQAVHVFNVAGMVHAGQEVDKAQNTGNPAIVVLPFENLSANPEHKYFCDGLTKDISIELSKFPNLFVIANKSAFSYQNQNKRAEEIGRELNVGYILEGAIQRSGEHIRVNAELADSRSGRHIWARRFDKDIIDVFAIQEELIELIVGALVPKLRSVERRRAARSSTKNINAYDAFFARHPSLGHPS
jgi:adenylate cyclase